ncbi:bifunctional 4-hydroxy-2-oxoglutarate aldolase/2-dehydro-3-deoxy-phosphogluconate aldolase [Microbacterium sp. UBA1612]|uniref:bifunctional 4-hydroxy-2-oxoglutarate aldolase/2-dehydro-3-deoxy-phosphogluconate aldolase n=1 Tax=Microbacterium sp. UBA1612 TaxID=1946942 RepID=UPI00257EB816|nr:bifunctional 4-hydroxy-2-oxoglutarate aldolase/2-dehydro-3-deoxy-phosphogluconate aldolase [Microbacterium sp. UBA1612]
MIEVERRLRRLKVLPVLTVDDPGRAVEVAHALVAGGLPGAEVTLRTRAGLEAIARLAGIDGFLVAAGTVMRTEDVERVQAAGAAFAVSPGFDAAVFDRSSRCGLPLIPGVATATEIDSAVRAGADAVKVFPATQLGGPPFVQAMAGPFPEVRFLPSGGIRLDSARAYLAIPRVLAVSGSWMVPTGAAPEEIERLARETVEALR